jgi:hypothetical protein
MCYYPRIMLRTSWQAANGMQGPIQRPGIRGIAGCAVGHDRGQASIAPRTGSG